MKISRSLRSQIYQAARKCVDGANPLFEYGLRDDYQEALTANALLWADDADLCYMVRLCDLDQVALDDKGEAELDLYATTGLGSNRELETNVYVRFNKDGVLWATADERRRIELAGDRFE